MSEDRGELPPDLEANEIDHFVSAVHASLGAVPGIGPLMAAMVTSVIPRQRLDRVAQMVRLLDERLSDLPEDFVRERMLRPGAADVVQAALPQAATSTEERLPYIVALLKNGLTSDELLYEQEKTLLSLLEQLNDSELIMLGWYGEEHHLGSKSEYYERHEDVLRSPLLDSLATDEEVREAALKEAYRDNLRRLGLAREGRKGRDQLTDLGRLLLERIDFHALQGLEEPT
jgi:hypothetical protein